MSQLKTLDVYGWTRKDILRAAKEGWALRPRLEQNFVRYAFGMFRKTCEYVVVPSGAHEYIGECRFLREAVNREVDQGSEFHARAIKIVIQSEMEHT